eukprot:2299597-Rhodomonas_salina.1
MSRAEGGPAGCVARQDNRQQDRGPRKLYDPKQDRFVVEGEEPGTSLRACYAESATALAHGAAGLRVCCAMH